MQVATEGGAGAQQQLACLACGQAVAVDVHHLDLHAGQRIAIGAEGAFIRIVQLRQRDGAVLGHAPGGHHLGAQCRTGLLHQRAGDGGAGAQEGLERGHALPCLRHGAGQVGQERGGGHGEGGAFRLHQGNGLFRLPDVLQHHAGLQHDGHHQAVHETCLVRHGGRHQHHVVGTERQALRVGNDVGHHRIGRMHHALGLARGARCVDELCHVVGAGPVAGEDVLRIGCRLPLRAAEQRLEAVGARAAYDHHMPQVGQAGLQAGDHGLEVEATEGLRRNHQLSFAMPEHEGQLTLTEDVHQRVHHRADA